jgi:hypothetical protein
MARRSTTPASCYPRQYVKHIKNIEPVMVPGVELRGLDRSAVLLLELIARGEQDYAEGRTISHAEACKALQRQIAEL